MQIPLLSKYSIRLYTHRGVQAGHHIIFDRPCIGLVCEGGAEILLDGQTYTAGPGDLIYIAAETEYYSVWGGSPTVSWYSVDFSFSDPMAFSAFRFQILHHYPAERLQRMHALIDSDPLRSLAEFYALLSDLYSKMEQRDYVPKYAKIRPAVEYLNTHYTEPIRISQLAALCGYSEAHFFALFQKQLGISPITYKTNLQIQQAIRQLLETEDSLDVIAARLGFSSANYFCRVFLKTVKRTPGEIRRSGERPHLARATSIDFQKSK